MADIESPILNPDAPNTRNVYTKHFAYLGPMRPSHPDSLYVYTCACGRGAVSATGKYGAGRVHHPLGCGLMPMAIRVLLPPQMTMARPVPPAGAGLPSLQGRRLLHPPAASGALPSLRAARATLSLGEIIPLPP